MWHHFTNTAEETFALGERLGALAFPGTVVSLIGDLGAGKTVFARGVGAGLKVCTHMASPTFVVVHTHEGGRLPLWHADLYRINEEEELEQLGLYDVLDADGVVVIEWAERFPDVLPADRLEITLEHSAQGRALAVRATGPRHEALSKSLGG